MRRIRPSLLVLAELELWPNLILAAKGQGARVAIVNGRMSDHSFPGYRRFRPLVARLLAQVDLIAAQNDESADRFRALGAPPSASTSPARSSTTALRPTATTRGPLPSATLAGFAEDDVVFLAGSTQEPEEQIAVDIFRRLASEHPRLRLVARAAAPRAFRRGGPPARRIEAALAPPLPIDRRHSSPLSSILLVDTIGELGAWWGAATIAFVGGSFGPRGGQNMIEPAAYGAAVSFGPNTRNFRDIVAALLAANAAVVVHDADELESFVRRSLDEPAWAAAFGGRSQAFVLSQLGATGRNAAPIADPGFAH